MARTIYDFTWSEFCDWYVEMSKGRLQRRRPARPLAQRVLVGVLDGILRLVQPIMPFVAESIWQALNETAFERGLPAPEPAAESVVIAPWPSLPEAWRDPAMETRIGRMQELVRAVREVRQSLYHGRSENASRCIRALLRECRRRFPHADAVHLPRWPALAAWSAAPRPSSCGKSATHVTPDSRFTFRWPA